MRAVAVPVDGPRGHVTRISRLWCRRRRTAGWVARYHSPAKRGRIVVAPPEQLLYPAYGLPNMNLDSRMYGLGTVALATIGVVLILFIGGLAVTTVGVVLVITSVITLLFAVGKSFDELDQAEQV